MVYTIFAVIAIALDQWLKWWTSNNMVSDEIKSFIPGLLTLTNIHNEGAAFGMFTGGRFWFILIAGVFCLIVIIALAADWIKSPLARWSAVMVAAGGVGNCIDRVILGYVQDMFRFDFKIFGYEFPVFNIADIFITVFAIIFMLCVLLGDDKPKAKKAAYDDEEDDEDYEEEDEDDEVKPKKAGRFGALSGAAGRFMRKGVEEYEDEDEEDEDDEEEPAPVKMRSSRKPAPVDDVDDSPPK